MAITRFNAKNGLSVGTGSIGVVDSEGNVEAKNVGVTGSITPDASGLYDLGSPTKVWRNLYASNISGSLTGSNVSAGQVLLGGTGGVISGSNDFIWDNTNRRVGIGTGSPLGKFSVGSGTQSVVIDSTGTGGVGTIQSYNGTLRINDLGNNTVFNTGGGTVGIGTTNPPASKFFVSGSATLTDSVTIIKAGVVSPTGGAAVLDVQNSAGTSLLFVSGSGNIGVGIANPSVRLHVMASEQVHTIFASSNATRGYTDYRYNTNTVLGYFGTASGITTGGASADFAWRVETGALVFATSVNERARIDSSGNVGIGGSNPKSRLEVTGSTADNSAAAFHALNSSNSSLIYARNDGVVGVGTSSPAARFQVQGSTTATTPTMIVREGVASPTGGAGTFDVQNSGGTSILFVSGSGQVGIGNNSPYLTYKLDVAGSSTFGVTKRVFINVDTSATGELPAGGTIASNSSNNIFMIPSADGGTAGAKAGLAYFSTGTGWLSALEIENVSSGYSTLLLMKSGGSVGIGTATPAAMLTVSGTIVTKYNNGLEGYIAAGTYSAGTAGFYPFSNLAVSLGYGSNDTIVKYGAGNNSFIVLHGSTPSFSVNGSDNVSIGPSSYTARLFVSGSSTTSTPTMVVKEGVASPTGGVGVLNVQNSAGTSLFFVSGSGFVGVNTDNPAATFHVLSAGSQTAIFGSASATSSYVTFRYNTSTVLGYIGTGNGLVTGGASGDLAIRGGSSSPILFSNGSTERMRVDSVGNVGIGGTNPKSRLEVTGSTGDNTAAAIHALNASNTSLFYVRNDGNVGIGSTSPDARLDVNDGANGRFRIGGTAGTAIISDFDNFAWRSSNTFTNFAQLNATGLGLGMTTPSSRLFVSGSSTASTTTMIVREGVASPTGGAEVLDVQNSAGTSLFVVSGSGNVGIGTTTFLTNNRVAVFSAAPTSTFDGQLLLSSNTASSAADNGGQLNFQMFDGSSLRGSGFIKSAKENGTASNYSTYMSFGTRNNGDSVNTERLRIDSTGSIGIGTTVAGGRVFITGSTSTSQPAFVVRAGTAVQLDGTKILDILDSSGTGLFHVSGSGDVTVGVGNLVIGTSGKGIDFSATANAPSGTLGQEILDDYEEGSWTPGTTVGGGGTITSTRSGHYTKIGRVVHVKFFIEASAVSGTRTTLTITGLPFQVDVTYTNAWVECYQLNNTGGLTDDFSHGMVWTNATSNSLTFDIYETTSGAPIANPASFVIANTLISGHLTYFTNQ